MSTPFRIGGTAVVVAGGRVSVGPRVRAAVESAELVIAADYGIVHCLAQGWVPNLVVGDFDSTPMSALRDARARGWEIKTYPAEKDATDGELALREAMRRGADQILMLGVLDGDDRFDHALANVLMLTQPETEGKNVRLMDEAREVRLLRSRETGEITGTAGDIVSLLPLSEIVNGVTTWGLKYDLSGIALYRGSTRGVSNELVWPVSQVQLVSGLLLVIHEFGSNQNA